MSTAAVRLWSGYFRPHARAVIDRDELSDDERRIRRVVRWLKQDHNALVWLRDIRVSALGRTVKGVTDVEQLVYRLEEAGVLRHVDSNVWRGPGRPPRRWKINPAVTSLQTSVGNTRNTPNSSNVF